MKAWRIGICDQDIGFASGLMDYINAKDDFPASAVAFSGMAAVKAYLTAEGLDLILTDDGRCCREAEGELWFAEVRVLMLTEDLPEKEEKERRKAVFKYQSAGKLCREIGNYLRPSLGTAAGPGTVTAFYSPVGRAGCSTLAKAWAGGAADGTGLYISMENFVEKNRYVPSDLLFLIKTKSPDVTEALLRLQPVEGLWTVYVAGTYADLRDVSKRDLSALITVLLSSGRWSRIVFDIGSAALPDPGILDCFDDIRMPEPAENDIPAWQKTEMFLSYLEETGQEKLRRKIRMVKKEGWEQEGRRQCGNTEG